jgi:hypothetical protein
MDCGGVNKGVEGGYLIELVRLRCTHSFPFFDGVG